MSGITRNIWSASIVEVLFDTNVVLDILMKRAPHAEAAIPLLVLVEQKKLDGLLDATTVTTIHYLAHKSLGSTAARKHLRTLCHFSMSLRSHGTSFLMP